jgi:hypothetical protein
MGFFADIFRVKADTERKLIRLSSRVSEKAVFEYWLRPASLLPFIKAVDFSEWRGTESFKAKITAREAILGVKTSEGMTYFKMSDSHLWVMRAQVEAACHELGTIDESEKALTVPAAVTLDVLHRMQNNLKSSVEGLIRQQFEAFTGAIVGAVEARLKTITLTAPAVQPTLQEDIDHSPADSPLFIPSNLVSKDTVGETHFNQTSSEDNINEAVEALKKLKTRRKP